MREFLKGLDLDKETIDTIMSEYGKNVQGYKETVEDLKKTNETLEKNSKSDDGIDWKSKFEKLDAKIKQDEADAKVKAEDEALTETIMGAFGDKKFTSDYVKNGLINDIKAELAKAENKGRGVKEIFESLTKDKDGIFDNPNKPVDMPPAGNVKTNEITKEAFQKMGYLQRVNLKQENPELYQSLVK